MPSKNQYCWSFSGELRANFDHISSYSSEKLKEKREKYKTFEKPIENSSKTLKKKFEIDMKNFLFFLLVFQMITVWKM